MAAREHFEALRDELFIEEIVMLVRARVRRARGLVVPSELRDENGRDFVGFMPRAAHPEPEKVAYWVDPKDIDVAELAGRGIETLLRHAIEGSEEGRASDLLAVIGGAALDKKRPNSNRRQIRAASAIIERVFSSPLVPGEGSEERQERLASELAIAIRSSLGPYPPEAGRVDPLSIARACLAGSDPVSRCSPWSQKAILTVFKKRTNDPVEKDGKTNRKDVRNALEEIS